MAIEPIESLMNKIMNRYDGRPIGWNVLTNHKGNMLVLGPKEAYLFKIVLINPEKQTGVGIRIGDSHEMLRLVEGAPSWGFRPLSTMQTKELLSFCDRESILSLQKISDPLLSESNIQATNAKKAFKVERPRPKT